MENKINTTSARFNQRVERREGVRPWAIGEWPPFDACEEAVR